MAQVRGEVEKEGRVLVLRRVHVVYHLKIDPENREKARQVHGFHADYCPVARSLKGSIAISTELVMEDSG